MRRHLILALCTASLVGMSLVSCSDNPKAAGSHAISRALTMDDIPHSQYNKQLIEMAACGNIEMMQALIAAGAGVSYIS